MKLLLRALAPYSASWPLHHLPPQINPGFLPHPFLRQCCCLRQPNHRTNAYQAPLYHHPVPNDIGRRVPASCTSDASQESGTSSCLQPTTTTPSSPLYLATFKSRTCAQQHCHDHRSSSPQQLQQPQLAAAAVADHSYYSRLQPTATTAACSPQLQLWQTPVPHHGSHGSRRGWFDSSIPQYRSYSTASGADSGRPSTNDNDDSTSTLDAALEASKLLDELRNDTQSSMTPAEVVAQLDRFIVGQQDAKRAVAVAFRNRWRRRRVPEEVQSEISPKNILMIGPTGCGKTEIARRLAKLSDAPFVKVEATKFTEVGYHGRDVDTIIRDLVEAAIINVRQRLRTAAKAKLAVQVEEQLLRALAGPGATEAALDCYRERLQSGDLEESLVEVEVPAQKAPDIPTLSIGGPAPSFQGFERLLQHMSGNRRERRKVPVSEARNLLEEGLVEQLFPAEVVAKEALRVTQEDGIVFIDEIDKIVQPSTALRHGSDPSSEGVQRDLLPIIEGSLVTTKHGNVTTDHILFICSGAFHSSKPSDMLAELQGRLPIRVELKGLSAKDFERILTEPEYNMVKQQQLLLAAEGIELTFTPAAIEEVARVAELVNQQLENIGARRLHTVLERLVEDISFDAPERVEAAGGGQVAVVIDKPDVEEKLGELLEKQDLSKFIL